MDLDSYFVCVLGWNPGLYTCLVHNSSTELHSHSLIHKSTKSFLEWAGITLSVGLEGTQPLEHSVAGTDLWSL